MEVDAEDDPLNERVRRQRSISVGSETDVVNETGNYHLLSPVEARYHPGDGRIEGQQQRWDLNYHEAAIYIHEGENNDKFTAHPNRHDELPWYLITHSTWFYLLDVFAAMLLMLLALVEQPAVPYLGAAIWVHSTLELFGLLLIGLELGMRLKWLGTRAYLHHTRTMIKTVVLVIMAVEVIVVFIRQSQHFRVTRAIRPIFLLDSYYCRGTRRFIRQIIQSLPPILDMFTLLLFFMLMFSILGFYLFSDIPNDTYFQTFQQSFLSLFVLLTTANFPDVMMPSYKHSRWSAIFFIAYLGIELYFLMNLFLAVVYDSFLKMEKEKLKKLMLHKRVACQHCFRLLASKQNPTMITLKHFCGLMKYYKPTLTRRDVYLQFKALNVSRSGLLSLDEFYALYDIANLKWKAVRSLEMWFAHFRSPLDTILKALHKGVTSKWFDGIIYFIIFANFLWILGDTILISVVRSRVNVHQAVIIENEYQYIWVAVIFVAIYIVEIVLKILALGPHGYFSCGWNRFDFLVVLVSAIGLLLELADRNFYYLLVLRPLRLLRLFKMKRRLRDILGTIMMLFSRMVSIAIVMLLLYYSFAIIGIELFSRYNLKDSCINGSVEVYYRYTNGTDTGYYYLNSFENILISCVTLFELTVVNNWYIIMEGYACVSSPWSRIYFMMFYILTMVVMTVVVAFILEAFLFRIQYRDKMHGLDMEDDAMFKVDVALSPDELFMCHSIASPLSNVHILQQVQLDNTHTNEADVGLSDVAMTWFCGERGRSKDDFNMKMYKEEVEDWIAEEADRHHREAQELRLRQRHLMDSHVSERSRVT